MTLETNIQFLTPCGLCRRVLHDLICEKKLVMLLSSDMEKEFIRVLGYPKFGLTSKEIPPFIRNLRSNAELVRDFPFGLPK
jgi:cytidine deaminase